MGNENIIKSYLVLTVGGVLWDLRTSSEEISQEDVRPGALLASTLGGITNFKTMHGCVEFSSKKFPSSRKHPLQIKNVVNISYVT